MIFRTVIQQGGKNATGIEVPEHIVHALGAGKRPPVQVTLNGYTYRSTVAVMGGAFMFPVSAEVRAKAEVKGGDEVDVDLELDQQPREVALPDDFAAALARDTAARAFFEGLSYSHRRWYVLPIEGAKTEETRQRRIEKALELLRQGRKP